MVQTSSAADFHDLEPLWTSCRALIGPIAHPWQGDLWSRVLGQHLPNVSAHTFDYTDSAVESDDSRCDVLLDPTLGDGASVGSPSIIIRDRYTHVVLPCRDRLLRDEAGAAVAVFVHSSDLSGESASAGILPDGLAHVDNVYATEPSIVARFPGATWCPVIHDLPPGSPSRPPTTEAPAVLLASITSGVATRLSRTVVEGNTVDEALSGLEKGGQITLRRGDYTSPSDLSAAIKESHFVVEVGHDGDYGFVATEAMAQGRVVLGSVSAQTRDTIAESTGLDVPIVEVSPESLGPTLLRLVGSPSDIAAITAAGRTYVEQVHSGSMSAAALSEFLTGERIHPAGQATAIDEATQHPETARGRIVMLVDNDVVRDSRVQKQARSAAESGWDVVLLGITRKKTMNQRFRWRIGDARVRLLYKSTGLKQPRRRRTPAPLTSLLAYRTRSAEIYDELQVEAARRSLQHDRALRQHKELPRAPGLSGNPAVLVFRRAGFLVRRKAVDIRSGATERLVRLTQDGSASTSLASLTWQRALGDRSWRELDPSLAEWDLVFGDTIDRLKPDIIHANDFRMLGVGARAKVRARQAGRTVSLVWDAHEYLPGLKENPGRSDLALYAYEREHIPFADRVITVSETLADMLVHDHGLTNRPYIVENAPVVTSLGDPRWAQAPDRDARDLRQDCGLGQDEPLLVYCGVAVAERGLETIVRGLELLPGVHAAFVVSNPHMEFVVEMVTLAEQLGVEDRLHVVTYVPVDHIVPYLSGADIGVVAAHHLTNNEISLPTKFREYAHARLALVVSDVKTVSEIVRRYGIGEVFVAGDHESFAQAVSLVLSDKQTYRWRLNRPGLLRAWSWDAAAEVLDSVYASLEAKHQ